MISDETIISLMFDRNEKAIELMREKYEKLAFYIIGNILTDERDKEECVEDLWVHAWNHIPPKNPEYLGSYLSMIARNLALDRYRFNNAEKRNCNLAEAFEELEGSISDIAEPFDNTIIDEMNLSGIVNEFLAKLEKKTRIIFVKRYWYGEPSGQIAKEVGMTDSNVRTILHRTRNKLKKILKEEGIRL